MGCCIGRTSMTLNQANRSRNRSKRIRFGTAFERITYTFTHDPPSSLTKTIVKETHLRVLDTHNDWTRAC